AALGYVRGASAAALEQEFKADRDFTDRVVGDRLGAAGQRANVEVILQVAADARQRLTHTDTTFTQMIGRTDARQHQQLRRIERAAGKDHLAGLGTLEATVMPIVDTEGTPPGKKHM